MTTTAGESVGRWRRKDGPDDARRDFSIPTSLSFNHDSPTTKRARTHAPACPHPATMGGLCVACGAVVTAHVVAAAGDARADDGGVALR